MVQEDFLGADGEPIPQRKIAKRLGLSQSQFNEIRKADGKGAGVHALIALSKYTHMSIDALLGRELALPTQQRAEQLEALVGKVDELLRLLEEAGISLTPGSKARKVQEEIRRLGAAARHERREDERLRTINSKTPKKKAG